MIASLDELGTEARAVAVGFLEGVALDADADARAAVVEGLTDELCERLSADADVAAVEAAVAALGPLKDELDDGGPALQGQWDPAAGFEELGERIARSWWNPADPRLLVSRAVGWGWDLNLGAVAVRLGLIEPDAEAVPFTATPRSAFLAAAAVPATAGAAVIVHYLVRGRRLPARLPSHWSASGRPDRWVAKPAAVVADIAVGTAAAGLAGWAATAPASGQQRAGLIAGATLTAGLTASTAVARGLARPRAWALPVGLLATGTAVFGVLYGLARAGRDAEATRDLR